MLGNSFEYGRSLNEMCRCRCVDDEGLQVEAEGGEQQQNYDEIASARQFAKSIRASSCP